MFVRTMLKELGSEDTDAQLILLSLLRSMLASSAGAVTLRARVEATRARAAATERVNCILACCTVYSV
jgi:hypothetical protein